MAAQNAAHFLTKNMFSLVFSVLHFEFLSYLTDNSAIGGGPPPCQPMNVEHLRDENFGSKITGSQDFENPRSAAKYSSGGGQLAQLSKGSNTTLKCFQKCRPFWSLLNV